MAGDCQGDDDGPGGDSPEREECVGEECCGDVARGVDAFGEDGGVEGGEEDSDDGGVGAAEGGLGPGLGAERVPERESAADEEPGGEEDGEEAPEAVEPGGDLRLAVHGGAEVGGEGEEWAGDGLGGAVAGEELVVGEPVARDDFGAEEWEDDVAAAEDEGAGAVEAVEEAPGFAVGGGGEGGKDEEEREEEEKGEGGEGVALRVGAVD